MSQITLDEASVITQPQSTNTSKGFDNQLHSLRSGSRNRASYPSSGSAFLSAPQKIHQNPGNHASNQIQRLKTENDPFTKTADNQGFLDKTLKHDGTKRKKHEERRGINTKERYNDVLKVYDLPIAHDHTPRIGDDSKTTQKEKRTKSNQRNISEMDPKLLFFSPYIRLEPTKVKPPNLNSPRHSRKKIKGPPQRNVSQEYNTDIASNKASARVLKKKCGLQNLSSLPTTNKELSPDCSAEHIPKTVDEDRSQILKEINAFKKMASKPYLKYEKGNTSTKRSVNKTYDSISKKSASGLPAITKLPVVDLKKSLITKDVKTISPVITTYARSRAQTPVEDLGPDMTFPRVGSLPSVPINDLSVTKEVTEDRLEHSNRDASISSISFNTAKVNKQKPTAVMKRQRWLLPKIFLNKQALANKLRGDMASSSTQSKSFIESKQEGKIDTQDLPKNTDELVNKSKERLINYQKDNSTLKYHLRVQSMPKENVQEENSTSKVFSRSSYRSLMIEEGGEKTNDLLKDIQRRASARLQQKEAEMKLSPDQRFERLISTNISVKFHAINRLLKAKRNKKKVQFTSDVNE